MSSLRPDVVVAHYHEVGLKGKNRHYFERKLVENIRAALEGTEYSGVKPVLGRIIIALTNDSDPAESMRRLQKVFGLVHVSPALLVDAEMNDVVARSVDLARSSEFSTFRVRARRGSSSFPDNSQKVNEEVGTAIVNATGARVDLNHAEWTCHIELVGNKAYIYSDRIEGPGGLPVGASGKVLVLLSGGIDSPVAAWEIAKRGAAVEFIHFHGQPFADRSSVRQAFALARRLRPWVGPSGIWTVPFGDIQSEIVTSTTQELRIVLYRRFMVRIAEAIATSQGAEALVTGESLGQVASQTLRNIRAIDEASSEMPILRPLVGRDKTEIEQIARRIGTYEISIQPHQDCCVLFAPRRVTTHASFDEIAEAEGRLDISSLVGKGVANTTLEDVP